MRRTQVSSFDANAHAEALVHFAVPSRMAGLLAFVSVLFADAAQTQRRSSSPHPFRISHRRDCGGRCQQSHTGNPGDGLARLVLFHPVVQTPFDADNLLVQIIQPVALCLRVPTICQVSAVSSPQSAFSNAYWPPVRTCREGLSPISCAAIRPRTGWHRFTGLTQNSSSF